MHHRFSREDAPGFINGAAYCLRLAIKVGAEGGFVDFSENAALGDDFLNRGPAEFGDRLVRQNQVEKGAAIGRNVADLVSRRMQAMQKVDDALQGIERCGVADRRLNALARRVVQHDRYTLVGIGFMPQFDPGASAAGKSGQLIVEQLDDAPFVFCTFVNAW